MTGWTRAASLPARLSRWINFVRAALHHWTQRNRRFYDVHLPLSRVRRRRPILLGLEALKDRELLNPSFEGLSISAVSADLAQMRHDLATSAIASINAAQPSQAKSTPPASLGCSHSEHPGSCLSKRCKESPRRRVAIVWILLLVNSELAPNPAARPAAGISFAQKEGASHRNVTERGCIYRMALEKKGKGPEGLHCSDGARKTLHVPYSICDTVVGGLLALIPL